MNIEKEIWDFVYDRGYSRNSIENLTWILCLDSVSDSVWKTVAVDFSLYNVVNGSTYNIRNNIRETIKEYEYSK